MVTEYPRFYGTQYITIVPDRHCGPLEPLREHIRRTHRERNIADWLRLSLLLSVCMEIAERPDRRAA